MLTMIFLFYLIYSISVGEYLTHGRLGIPFVLEKTPEIYGLLLKIMIVFISGLYLFLSEKVKVISFPKVRDNIVVFYSLILVLMLIGIFGVNRSMSATYAVQISPYYEYSIILFCFAYFVSGEVKFREILWLTLIFIFIFQDYYYGGRITSLQLMLLVSFTILKKYLSKKNIILFSFLGILLNESIAVYRRNYTFVNSSFLNIFIGIKENLFVFDTPVYAYFASATHVTAVEGDYVSTQIRLESFFNFFKSIFLGGSDNSGNVTRYVSENVMRNIGGGIFPTHFYFWFGWAGVILSVLILVFTFNYLAKKNSDFSNLLAVICFITIPRWFLYNPLNLFRMIFLSLVVYYIYVFANKLTSKQEVLLK